MSNCVRVRTISEIQVTFEPFDDWEPVVHFNTELWRTIRLFYTCNDAYCKSGNHIDIVAQFFVAIQRSISNPESVFPTDFGREKSIRTRGSLNGISQLKFSEKLDFKTTYRVTVGVSKETFPMWSRGSASSCHLFEYLALQFTFSIQV